MTSPQPARERILLTAHDLFYANGILATGINQIIAEAKVTKVTFYRHFPAKQDLVLAYLDYRHEIWMAWFRNTLAVHVANSVEPAAIVAETLRDWLQQDSYRGCALINASAELGSTVPEVLQRIQAHKAQMIDVLQQQLAPLTKNGQLAGQIGLLIDGAIVTAQRGVPVEDVISLLNQAVMAMLASVRQQ